MVKDHAKPFVGSNHCRYPHEPLYSSEDPPPTAYARQCEHNGDDEAEDDVGDAHGSYKEHSRLVSITDRPSNEVGM